MVAYLQKLEGTTARTNDDREVEITARINGQVKTIIEASLRRHLKLEDSDGITSLPNIEIFKQLALMGAATTDIGLEIDLVTKLTDRVEVLEIDLQQTKKVYSSTLTKLIIRVKKLEHRVKIRQPRRRARVIISDTKEDLEDPSKQGRRIAEINQNPSISLVQDEGNSWIQEDVEIQGKTSVDTEILLDQEEPTELVEDLGSGEKEERQRIARDSEIAKQLQAEFDRARQEQEVVAKANQAHDIDWSDPAMLRYHALQNRSFFVAEVRKNMCMYLKNQGGYKQSHFKGMSYEDIRLIFERVWDQNHAFVLKDSEIENEYKKRSREDSNEDNAKKQKLEDDAEKEELRDSMDVVPRDDITIDVEADGSSKYYKIFSEMLDDFERQDVMDLHRVVQEMYDTTSLEGYDLLLWGDLKILFEPNEEDEIWKNQ
ncbi:hypothetical protein Tco_1389716 [Tanacetum coccineum]